MKTQANRIPKSVWLLILLQFLLGLGAFVSGILMMAFPDGSLMQMPLDMLKYSPFPHFFIPGAILCTLLGVFPLAVAYSLWQRPSWRWPEALNPAKGLHWSWSASWAAGVILVIWITVQVVLLRSIAFLHVLYFVWGWVLIVLTLIPGVHRHYAR
jgi:hypothetical protein